VIDQRAGDALVDLTLAVQAEIERRAPAVVVVHPYEGGHPDHDAAAFAAHAAVRRIRARRAERAPILVEMTSYHRRDGALRTGEFLPPGGGAVERWLVDAERARKTAMLRAYASQSAVLAPFGVQRECFRRPPAYDFGAPPHPGQLHYEQMGWRWSGAQWRRLAVTALDQLGLGVRAPAIP
jgi:N-acetylglucosamine malate deacetylase 2